MTLIEPAKQAGSKRLTVLGACFTFAYIAFIAWYWSDQSSSLTELSPNEFGDFLAGVFAPLAFLWLVLGFVQQGLELRYSAEALWLQGEELRNSVEQQRSLVDVTKEQLALEKAVLQEQKNELERTSQPIFDFSSNGWTDVSDGQATFKFSISNQGRACTGVKISSTDGLLISSVGALNAGQFSLFNKVMSLRSEEEDIWVVDYIDFRTYYKSQKFLFIKNGASISIIEFSDKNSS